VSGFVDHLHTPPGTTSNFSAIANLHNSQITTAPAKPFSSPLYLHQPFPRNGFWQWRFFIFPRSGPVFTPSRAELNSQLTGSESESYITTDGQSPICVGVKNPSGAYDQIFITVRELRVCWCGALCLTRGRVCRLQILLILASAVTFGSESRGTRDHILLSEIRDFSFRRLLRLAGLRWRYSTPPPHCSSLGLPNCLPSSS
jgi:hypothetical protein